MKRWLLLRTFVVLSLLLGFATAGAQAVTYCCDATAEAQYLSDLAALGVQPNIVNESFEAGPWVDTRVTFPLPPVVGSITNLGITWSRASGGFYTSTGGGNVQDGSYLMYAVDSGGTHAVPDAYVLSSAATDLHGVGGWFRGTGAKLAFIVDGDAARVDFTGEESTVISWKFLGFIDTTPFQSVEVRTADEVGNETNTFFSDAFDIGTTAVVTSPPGDLQLEQASYTTAENVPTLSINVSRVGGSAGPVTVDYAAADGTAIAGSDYTATSGTLSFADGIVRQTIVVPILDDTTFEDAESFSVSLSNPGGGAGLGAPVSATVTINDDDPTPPAGALQFDAGNYVVAEDAGTLTATVTRTGGGFGTVTVQYATSDDSATAGSDYTTVSGTLTFADGVLSQPVSVPIIDDSNYEGDEDFQLDLFGPGGGATLGAPVNAFVTIQENDPTPPAGSLGFAATDYAVAENGTQAQLTVSRSGGSFGAVTVDYATTDGSATASADYLAALGTLNFADGELSKVITVTILDDTDFEGDESFSISLANPGGGATLGATAASAITILEDDAQPPAGALRLDNANYAVAENGVSATILVSRVGGSFGAVTVDYATADGTAVAGTDYSVSAGTLELADGVISATFTVPILDDTDYEGDKQFTVALSNATGGATLDTPSSANVTIVEDDPQPPSGSLQFSGSSYTVDENGGSLLATISRTGGTFGTVGVTYSTTDGTAESGTDYTATSGTATLAEGEVSASLSIPILNDSTYEGDETFSISLSNPTGGAALGSPTSATATIVEDDPVPPAGSVQFSGTSYTVNENGAQALLTVTRSGGSFGTITVDYATAEGTASAVADFASASGTLTLTDGITTQALTVDIVDDVDYEGDETFTVTLSNPGGGATTGNPATATVVIVEDDPVPSAGVLQFSGPTYAVLESGLQVTATVTRIGGSFGSTTVDYATVDASATAGSDYTAAAGTLTFADGVISQAINVGIIDNSTYEGDESFGIVLSNPTGGATLGNPASATVTINEDDATPPAGSLQYSGAAFSVGENGGQLAVSVVRTGGSFGAVTVDYATSDGTATAGSDYSAAAGTLTFADGETTATFNVAILDDVTYEGDEFFSLLLGNATGGATIGSPATASATILEDDAVPPAGSLSFSSAGYSVNENSNSVQLTVSRTGGSFGTVGADYASSDGTATATQDYQSLSGTVILADGETSRVITATIVDDTVFEGDENFFVTLSNATGSATIGAQSTTTVTILEDDPIPPAGIVQFSGTAFAVNEDGGVVVLTIARVGASYGAVAVDYATADGTATAATDYQAASGTASFADGETSKSITVSVLDDLDYEGDEDFVLILSNVTGEATLGSPATATVTIADNETPPPSGSLQFSTASYSVAENAATMQLTVSRTGGDAGTVSVDYTTADDTATASADYIAATGTLSFAEGEISKTVDIAILDDTVYEADETFVVNLGNVQGGATLGSIASAFVTIVENDLTPPAGALRFSGPTYSVTEGSPELAVTVDRVGGDFGTVAISFGTIDGVALAGSDYTLTRGTLTFADGETSKSFTVPIIDDNDYEGDETFTLRLQNPSGGATLDNPSSATVTIVENDAPPTSGSLQFSGTAYSAGEGDGIVTATIVRTGGSFGAVSVDYATSDATATADSDYTALAGTLTFADGVKSQSVSISIIDDSIHEGDETFSISITNPVGGAILGAQSMATITIVENDAPPQAGSLQFSGTNYSVNESSANIQVTVTRTGGSDGEVSVEYGTEDRTAGAGDDYRSASGRLTFADGETSRTLTVDLIDDSHVEGNESFAVELTAVAGGAMLGTPAAATVTIQDNDRISTQTGGGGGGAASLLLVVSVAAAAFLRDASRAVTGLACLALLIASGQTLAEDPHAKHRAMAKSKEIIKLSARYDLANLQVTVMQGVDTQLLPIIDPERPVALNFIFTTCTTICPVQTATFAQVQRRLGEEADTLQLISVSIDPEHDTPARLREFAERFGAGSSWQFLTGTAQQMIDVQRAFDAYMGNKMSHRPLTFLKAAGSDTWVRLEGMASANRIIQEYRKLTGEI